MVQEAVMERKRGKGLLLSYITRDIIIPQIDAKRCIAIIDLKQKEIEDYELQKNELLKSLEEYVVVLNQMKWGFSLHFSYFM